MSPAAFANQNSYAILAGAVLLLAGWLLVRGRATWPRIAMYVAFSALLVVPSIYVRASSPFSEDALAAALASGKPTLLEVYSPY